MEENLKWLFAAFTIGWALILGYLVLIANKERDLRRRMAILEASLAERERR